MKRRRYSREQWLEWLIGQRTSGLRISAFCEQKQVSENSFYAWRRKLDGELDQVQASSPFIPLAVVGAEPLQIELPCGAKIWVPADESSTRRVLKLLLDLGGSP